MPRLPALLIPLAFALFLIGAVDAEPIGGGWLGATEQVIARKLGAPDARAVADDLLLAPAVRAVLHAWKPAREKRLVVFGFDKDGIVRNVQPFEPWNWTAASLSAFESAIASGWTADTEANKVYPTVDVRTPHVGNYIRWLPSHSGVQFGVRTSKIDGIDREGVFRSFTLSRGQEAYAMREVHFRSRSSTPLFLRALVISDASAFWGWTLEELSRQWWKGLPPDDPAKRSTSVVPYEHWLRSRVLNVVDERALIAERMTPALVAMVRNPHVDLKPAVAPTEWVGTRHNQTLSKQMLTMFASASWTVRERIATLLCLLDDPAAVEPMIRELRSAKPIPSAVKVLRQFTADDFGVDADRWQAWWTENRKNLVQAHEARLRERASSCMVTHAQKGKLYHQPEPADGPLRPNRCPVMVKENTSNSLQLITVAQARAAGWQPCPNCKPPR